MATAPAMNLALSMTQVLVMRCTLAEAGGLSMMLLLTLWLFGMWCSYALIHGSTDGPTDE